MIVLPEVEVTEESLVENPADPPPPADRTCIATLERCRLSHGPVIY